MQPVRAPLLSDKCCKIPITLTTSIPASAILNAEDILCSQSERDSSGLNFISMTWKGQRSSMRKRSVSQFLMSRPGTMRSSTAAGVLFALSGRG